MDLSAAYAYASERMTCNMDSQDAREGIDAFIQKRKPRVGRALSAYNTDLDKNAANYTPLSPLTFIERAAAVYPATRRANSR